MEIIQNAVKCSKPPSKSGLEPLKRNLAAWNLCHFNPPSHSKPREETTPVRNQVQWPKSIKIVGWCTIQWCPMLRKAADDIKRLFFFKNKAVGSFLRTSQGWLCGPSPVQDWIHVARHDAVIRFEGRLMMPQMRAAVHQDSTVLQPVHHRMALRTQGVAPLVEPGLFPHPMGHMIYTVCTVAKLYCRLYTLGFFRVLQNITEFAKQSIPDLQGIPRNVQHVNS